jgi:hypothetical protein
VDYPSATPPVLVDKTADHAFLHRNLRLLLVGLLVLAVVLLILYVLLRNKRI